MTRLHAHAITRGSGEVSGGYLQADAYAVYHAFFKSQHAMTEVGCWMHARRCFFKALESDEPNMGPALHLMARMYKVEERAKALSLSAEQRLALGASDYRRGCSANSTSLCWSCSRRFCRRVHPAPRFALR